MTVTTVDCCIAGGGPAGVVLAHLLARQGIRTALLESHADFNRDFRGDTMHASTLEALDQLGLADEVMALAHARISVGALETAEKRYVFAEFSRLRTKFPFIAVVPQEKFLDLLCRKTREHEEFTLMMNTRATDLVEENGRIVGVRAEGPAGPAEIRARLVVAADGRGSVLRGRAGFEITKTAPPMDVLWFKLSKKPDDALVEGFAGKILGGTMVVAIDRGDYYQMGYIVMKGGMKELKARGLPALKETLVRAFPPLRDRVDQLGDWSDCALLVVQTGVLDRWWKDGFLAIGDAAHIMSPVGGIGINYAIQDAIATANAVTEPFVRNQNITPEILQSIQDRRMPATRAITRFQSVMQRRIIARALDASHEFVPPFLIRLIAALPPLRGLPARMVAFGKTPERIRFVEKVTR